MYTECSHCNAVFLVTYSQLAAAAGKVRCGECGQVFAARLMTLSEPTHAAHESKGESVPETSGASASIDAAQLPPISENADTLSTTADSEPFHGMPDDVPEAYEPVSTFMSSSVEPPPVSETPRAYDSIPGRVEPHFSYSASMEEVAETGVQDEVVPVTPPVHDQADSSLFRYKDEVDSELNRKSRDGGLSKPAHVKFASAAGRESVLRGFHLVRRALLMLLGISILGGLLFAQWVLSDEEHLARFPHLQAYAVTVCELIGCDPPYPRQLDQIEIVSRNVVVDPSRPGGLVVTARFVNTSDKPQPYPLLKVTLTDVQGQPVAEKRFKPEDYWPHGAHRAALMQPGEPVDVKLELADPGENAVAFQFDFL